MSSKNTTELNPATITKASWQLYKKYFWQVVCFGLIAAVVGAALEVADPKQSYWIITNTLSLVIFAITEAVFLLSIDKREHKRTVHFPTLIQQVVPVTGMLFLNNFLWSFLFFGGLLLLVIPGLIWGTMFSQAFNYAVFEKKGVKEAFVASKNITKGKRWEVFTAYAYILVPYMLLSLIAGGIDTTNVKVSGVQISFAYALVTVFVSYLLSLQSYSIWRALKATHIE